MFVCKTCVGDGSDILSDIRNEIQMQKPFGNVSLILSYNNNKLCW